MMKTWTSIDPSRCRVSHGELGVLFLWFMPAQVNRLCGGGQTPSCAKWAAEQWKRYAARWKAVLAGARRNGLKVAAPMFDGNIFFKFQQFFEACPECNNPDSPYYIDVFAFNAEAYPHSVERQLRFIQMAVS